MQWEFPECAVKLPPNDRNKLQRGNWCKETTDRLSHTYSPQQIEIPTCCLSRDENRLFDLEWPCGSQFSQLQRKLYAFHHQTKSAPSNATHGNETNELIAIEHSIFILNYNANSNVMLSSILQNADSGATMDRIPQLSGLLQRICGKSSSTNQSRMWPHHMPYLLGDAAQEAVSIRSGELGNSPIRFASN